MDSWQIARYDLDGGNPETFITTNLAWPQDILFLDNQNLCLVTNLNTSNITKYDANTGEYLGVYASGISGATRMAMAADSSLYVLQWTGNGKVKRFDKQGNFIEDFTDTGVPQSIGLAWDMDSNLYVSSYQADEVYRFNKTGALVDTFISSNLVGPTNIFFEGTDLIVLDYDGNAIKRFDSNGTFVSVLVNGLSQSEGISKKQ